MAISIPTRAQDSDPDTSQDQEGNTAEKDCAEKPESARAQEAPVHIDSQKRSNPNAQAVSDHFGTTNAAEKSVWMLKFSQRTAQRYLKLYEERHDPKYATVTDLKDAYNNNDLEEVPGPDRSSDRYFCSRNPETRRSQFHV
jgi:hypothetical protein